jgi:hypothetical protein
MSLKTFGKVVMAALVLVILVTFALLVQQQP